jgi:hypothetical protein
MLFRSVLLSAAFWVLFLAALRVGAVPPEDCGRDGTDAIHGAALGAMYWIQRNQLSDGTYVYEYNAETDELTPQYNNVRHAGVTMSVYQAFGKFRQPETLKTADRAMDWMIENTVRRHGWAALSPAGEYAELGASDLMLVSLLERELAVDTGEHDDLMRELGRFIVAMQKEDGNFYIGYDLVRDEPRYEGTSRYYPGESLLGLAMLHNMFPGEGWDGPALKALDYLTTKRDELEDVDFPPLPDQWTAMAIGEMAGWGLSEQQVDYVHLLAARFGLLVRTEAQRQGSWYGLEVRGRHARGAGAGTWVEGLTGLWRSTWQDERLHDLREPLLARALCMSGILAENQVTRVESDLYSRPGLAEGAWFTDGATRMDDQQHVLSGMIQTLDAAAGFRDRQRILSLPLTGE